MAEELLVGNVYHIDLSLWLSDIKSASTDHISDAVDYSKVYQIVREEMNIRSNLIEHVSQRLGISIFKKFPSIRKVKIRVKKICPPLKGSINYVSFDFYLSR